MHPQDQEPGMNALLARLGRDLPDRLDGATDEEFEQLEHLAGRPLPRFYRWFVSQMGRRIGLFANSNLDCSAPTVIASYADELVEPDQRYFMIGLDTDPMTPLHLYYDLDQQVRDDARVVSMEELGGAVNEQFETLREMFAWSELCAFGVNKSPQRCDGLLTDDDGDVRSKLDPVMKDLGLEAPSEIPTGRSCGLYVGADMNLVTSANLDGDPGTHGFVLGGRDAGALRRTLGEIAIRSDMSLEIGDWEPPLSEPT